MIRLLFIGLLVAATASCSRSNSVPTSASAAEALHYLNDQDGVIWHVIEGNCVFILFPKPAPKNLQEILNGAALAGNKAAGYEFVAMGITGDNANWRAYVDSNTIGIATARDSKLIE